MEQQKPVIQQTPFHDCWSNGSFYSNLVCDCFNVRGWYQTTVKKNREKWESVNVHSLLPIHSTNIKHSINICFTLLLNSTALNIHTTLFFIHLLRSEMFILSIIVTAIVLIKKISTTSILSEAIDYKNFRSEIYPDYGVRYISPTLCDPNVTQVCNILLRNYKLWS